MIVERTLLIPGRQTPVLLQPIAPPFDPLAETVEGPIKGTGPIFLLLPWNGTAAPGAAQVLPNLATTRGLVTPQTTRPAFGAPTPVPFHRPACHQGGERPGFVPWTRGAAQCHPRAPAFGTDMAFRTEAALTVAERVGCRAP
jgi:hypothetical protein